MASQFPEDFVVHVIFKPREDGGLIATCKEPELANFYLSHSDADLVREDVIPALETILSDMYGMRMSVRRLSELSEVLDRQIPMPALLGGEQSYLGVIER